MGLGADKTVCKVEFVEAMRARLAAEDPALADNVDRPEVEPNLAALGEAVYRILRDHAETRSGPDTDAPLWAWLEAVELWLGALSGWQQGVAAAVAAWTPAQPAEQALKAAITGLAGPGAPPTLPAIRELRGRIE